MIQPNTDDRNLRYPIVGRPDVDLSNYLVVVRGKNVIDYEKMKNDDPELYKQILADEHEVNRQDEIELDKLKSA